MYSQMDFLWPPQESPRFPLKGSFKGDIDIERHIHIELSWNYSMGPCVLERAPDCGSLSWKVVYIGVIINGLIGILESFNTKGP